MLGRYFWDGLCSCTMLCDFLDEGSEVLEISPEFISRETFEKYEPGLLCAFDVFEDFFEAVVLRYTGITPTHCIERHCMVVLGVRTQGQNRMFLLQNWWRNKQFVEVSEEYMTILMMECTICFVSTPQKFYRYSLPS